MAAGYMEILTQNEAAQARIAFDLLAGSAPLFTVVQDWLSRRQIASTITLADAIEEHLKDLAARSRTKNVNNRRSVLYRLKERLGDVQLSDVTLSHCTAFLDALQGRGGAAASTFSYNGVLSDTKAFFQWCVDKREWIKESPVRKLDRRKHERDLVKILSLEQTRALFKHLEGFEAGRLCPYFALATFAGLRPEEIKRLASRTDMIDLAAGVIRITEAISKTHQHRTVTIRPNLKAWLERHGLDLQPVNVVRDLAKLRETFSLSQDICRHTFASNHIAAFGSFAEEAMEAGHSEAVARRHYVSRVAKADAEEFWKIEPKE